MPEAPAATALTTATTTTASAAPGTQPAVTTAPPAANAPDFAKEWNVAPEVGTWMGESGFKTPADFASAFMATKKLVGHDPANIIVKPKEGDSAARLAALRALGAPANAADYGFKAPEGGDEKFMNAAAAKLAELGIPKAEAAALFGWFNETQAAQAAGAVEASESKRIAEFTEFKTKLGGEYGRVEAQARAAAREAGLTPDQGVALETALGVEGATMLMAKLGAHFVEAAWKGGDQERAGLFGVTPEGAQAELDALRIDKGFQVRFANGDVDARKKVAALIAIIADATPTPATANATPAYGNVPMQRSRTASY
jgi:hypothetical protein